MENIEIPSPGKLNLFLRILSRQPDGYHNIQTAFQFINWCDKIVFSKKSCSEVTVFSNDYRIEDSKNLITIAATHLKKLVNYRFGATIKLNKVLPIGGGMGGGSSNAATTLIVLNKIWDLNISLKELIWIGRKIGADVPAFIHGYSAWAEGIGHKLSSFSFPESWYVLLIPHISICTKTMYEKIKCKGKFTKRKLKQGAYEAIYGQNDFEFLLRRRYHDINEGMEYLESFSTAQITGTGSTLFAAFDTKEEADKIASLAPKKFKAQVVKGLNKSPLHDFLKIGV